MEAPLLTSPSHYAVFIKASLASDFPESKKTRQWQLWGLGRAQVLTPLGGCGSAGQVTIKDSLYEEGDAQSVAQFCEFLYPQARGAILIRTSWEMNY